MYEVERRIARLSARAHLGTAKDDELLACVRQRFDWGHLVDVAASEGVAGVVAHELQRAGKEIGEDPSVHFSRAIQPVFVNNGAHLSELLKLGDALQPAGLRAIVLKGGALLTTVYEHRLALRPLSDIDLLVRADELAGVAAVLRSRGFLAPSTSPNVFTKGTLAFDLHTDLVGSERIRRRSRAFQLESLRLWEDARRLNRGNSSLLLLSEVHQFLHCSIHALKHSYSRLIWLLDLALLLRRLDWDEMVEEAKASGTTRAVAYTLHVLQRAFDVELPSRWAERFPSLNGLEQAFVGGVVRRSEASSFGELMVSFSIPTWRGRLSYLIELLYPRRTVLSLAFPRSPRWLLIPRRSAQMLGRGLAKLTEIVGGFAGAIKRHAGSRKVLESVSKRAN